MSLPSGAKRWADSMETGMVSASVDFASSNRETMPVSAARSRGSRGRAAMPSAVQVATGKVILPLDTLTSWVPRSMPFTSIWTSCCWSGAVSGAVAKRLAKSAS